MTSQPPPAASPSSDSATDVYSSTQELDSLETAGDNETGVPMSVEDRSASSHTKDDGQGLNRLNKRQVLVISTCSTVIGTFSVVALILRLRNYMKRTKQDKDSARRHHVRSSSLNVHREHHHHESRDTFSDGHRDALSPHDRRWSHLNPFSTDR